MLCSLGQVIHCWCGMRLLRSPCCVVFACSALACHTAADRAVFCFVVLHSTVNNVPGCARLCGYLLAEHVFWAAGMMCSRPQLQHKWFADCTSAFLCFFALAMLVAAAGAAQRACMSAPSHHSVVNSGMRC
jgi:hypothetical protein